MFLVEADAICKDVYNLAVKQVYFTIIDTPYMATHALGCRQKHLPSHLYCIINLYPHSISNNVNHRL